MFFLYQTTNFKWERNMAQEKIEFIGAKLQLRVQGRVFLGLFALHQAMLV